MAMSSTFYNASTANNYLSSKIDYSMDTPTWGGNTGVFKDFKNFTDFVQSVHEHGLFHTVYGKSFPQVAGEFIKETSREVGIFVLVNGDLLFLIPAVVFMFLTFFIGRNKFTKWILPLWFAYFVSRVFLGILL